MSQRPPNLKMFTVMFWTILIMLGLYASHIAPKLMLLLRSWSLP